MITRLAEGAVIICMSLAGGGAGSIVTGMMKAEPVGMRLISLEYDQGIITQKHEVFGVDLMQAEWTVKVIRGRTHICGGSGRQSYGDTDEVSMAFDKWVGEACPDLQNGDKLKASWEWSTEDGSIRGISGLLELSGLPD